MPRRYAAIVFRLLLIVGAVALLVRQPIASLRTLILAPATLDEPVRVAGLTVVAAALVAGLLTLSFADRANVHLLLVPAVLALWLLDAGAAVMLAGGGALLGNAFRRARPLAGLAGAGRTVLAVGAGAALAPLAAGWTAGGPGAPGMTLGGGEPALGGPWLAAAAALTVASSLVDWLLDQADRLVDPARRRPPAVAAPHSAAFIDTTPLRRQSQPAERDSRMDPVTNVLVLPLALFFQVVYVAVGFRSMAVVLGGLFALLLVIRTFTNLRTLHESLEAASARVTEQREKLVTLFEQSGEGIYTVDNELRLGTINEAMARLLDVSPEAVEGQECARICHFEDLQGQRLCPERCPLRRAHQEQQPVTQEAVYQLPDQPPRHLLLTYTAVGEPGGPLTLGVGIARDMTAQKEAERLRDEFVSLVTHELRSPLTVSIGYIDLLKRGLQGPDGASLAPDRALYYVTRVEGAERHLLRLVNNLLEMARVERPDLKLELAELELDTLLQEVVDGSATVAAQKSQTMTLQMPDALPLLWTSELYLREVFSNLLSNAVKYTPEGGTVTVTVAVERESGGRPQVRVTVADTGYGMSAEDLGRLFSKFFRSGRPEVRRERGTGLGLALTKQMVEKLGGAISVVSEEGKGSSFTVTLPVTAPPPPEDDAPEDDAPEDDAPEPAPIGAAAED